MWRLVAVIILSSMTFAQNSPDREIASAAKSPYDFSRCVDTHPKIDWKSMWTALGVKDTEMLGCGSLIWRDAPTATKGGGSSFQEDVHVKNVSSAEDDRRASHLVSPDALALDLAVAVTFLTLVAVLGYAGTFWLYGVIGVVAWIFFYRLVPETKGKTLEQIEEHWRSGKPARAL